MKYNKLVRDKIPGIITGSMPDISSISLAIKKEGKTPVVRRAKRKEYWNFLKKKLKEEIKEFWQKEDIAELFDVLEVIYAICDFQKVSKKELEHLRKIKAKKRGSFRKRIILKEVVS